VSVDRRPGRHLALVGPTASGKSAVAMALAVRRTAAGTPTEIVSCDALQVYRGMDVGTAKPTPAEQAEVPHHLIDLVDIEEDFSVARFRRAYDDALVTIASRRHRAVAVGGTGLYVRAVLDRLDLPGRYPDVRAALDADADTAALHERLRQLDPVAAGRMEPSNRRRVVRALEVTLGSGRPFSSFGPGLDRYDPLPSTVVGLRIPRDELDRRIAERVRRQLDTGFVDEVDRLLATGRPWSRTAAQALGYRELRRHLEGELTLAEAEAEIVIRTRRFARRQERWFRRDPRIVWVDAGEGHNPLVIVDALLGDSHS
jgi:tRNA dimethylallyltransferase